MFKKVQLTYKLIYTLANHSNAFSLVPNTLWFFLPVTRSITLNATD